MRVALFIDGKNFYHGLKKTSQDSNLDFGKMAKWLTAQVGGDSMAAAHYYTGVESSDNALPETTGRLNSFLNFIQSERGFYVHRFLRHSSESSCAQCGSKDSYTYEKQVDTSIVADMVKGAALNSYDVAILLSGDADFIPAIETVKSLGKTVYVATWNNSGESKLIGNLVHDVLNLAKGLNEFQGVKVIEEQQPITENAHAAFLEELGKAEEKFHTIVKGNDRKGFVGQGFFVNSWTAGGFSYSPDMRMQILDELVALKKVEVYNPLKDCATKAIRTIRN